MTIFYLDPVDGCDVTRDSSNLNHLISATSAAPPINAGDFKYGLYSLDMLASGNSSSALTIPPSAGFQFGAGQFTVEAWVKFVSHGTSIESVISNFGGVSDQGFRLDVNNNVLGFNYSTTGGNALAVAGAYTPADGAWIHLAADRDASNVLRVYANGVVIASATVAASLFPSTRTMYVGADSASGRRLPGRLGALRITKGLARYAGAFTPPVAAFPETLGGDASFALVTLLLNFNKSGDGMSFSNRWKTLSMGATAANVAPGDTVRVIASPEPTLIGDCVWTQYSKNITLPSAVTVSVADCNAAWVGAANVTQTADTAKFKEGGASAKSVIAAAFSTGKVAHFAIPNPAVADPIINRAANLLGIGSLTMVQNANADESNVAVNLPFAIAYNGVSYNTIYITSNSYVTFGASQVVYSGLGGSNPSVPNIQINAGDRAYQRVYAGSEDGNATFRIRYEGSVGTSGTPGASTVIWEMTFTAATPTVIKIDMGANASSGSGVSGMSNGIGTYVASFASGTANTGYTLTSALPGGATLDLSAYQQLSFWFQCSVAIDAGVLALRLCTDTTGDTAAHTLPIPAVPYNGVWVPLTLDLGAPMHAAIKSISLVALTDPGANTINIDNVIVCKAAGSADALDLTSLIGKVRNLSWTATTAYALNAIRRPCQVRRNGFCYKATTAGITGVIEPTWPEELGVTVADGSVVWTCFDLEDTWYPIQSIVGTTVKVDTHNATLPSAGRGYDAASETVATYRRITSKQATGALNTNSVSESGTALAPLTYSGGWDRTAMSTQSGETWLDIQYGDSTGIIGLTGSREHITVENISVTRASYGMHLAGNDFWVIRNCHFAGCKAAVWIGSASQQLRIDGMVGHGGTNEVFAIGDDVSGTMRNVRFSSSPGAGVGIYSLARVDRLRIQNLVAKNNGTYGLVCPSFGIPPELVSPITENNAAGALSVPLGAQLSNALLAESVEFAALSNRSDSYIYSHKHDQLADNHLITTDGGTIVSATDQRHTESGISWKFRPTSTVRSAQYPLKLSVAKIACTAGGVVNVAIWTRRSSTNVKGQLMLLGGQIAGVPSDVVVACEPAIDTWALSGTLAFTPSESGVVEILFRVYDGVGTTNSFWIDDLVIA